MNVRLSRGVSRHLQKDIAESTHDKPGIKSLSLHDALEQFTAEVLPNNGRK